MTFISYAQHAEDVLINRFFGGRETGFYIDIGAYHPTIDSVTKHFYDLGWSGINVEPVRSCFALFQEERSRDVNLEIAVSDHSGWETLFEFPSIRGLSTLLESEARLAARRHHVEPISRVVRVRTLASICEELGVERYDFLKIDVEGHEAEVLSGADLVSHRPELLLIESTHPGSSKESHEKWEGSILASGYVFAFFDGLNRYYVAREQEEKVPILQVPPNPFDGYTTRKLMRLKEPEVRAALKLRKFLLRHPALRSVALTLIGQRRER